MKKTNIIKCSACGLNHKKLTVFIRSRRKGKEEQYVICPETGTEVYIKGRRA